MRLCISSVLILLFQICHLVKSDGLADCPCLTSLNGTNLTRSWGSYDGYDYPLDYGVGCAAHDAGLAPSCNTDDNPDWCTEQFCYVDTEACTLPIIYLSSYWPKSKLYYSAQTCGSNGSLFTDWFAYTSELTALSDKVETYVLNMRSELEAVYSDSSIDYSCDFMSGCDCLECEANQDWGINISMSETVLTPKANSSAKDITTCVASEAADIWLEIAGNEYSDPSEVGTFYMGFQDDAAYSQWPALDWCPSSYDPRFRPWYSAAVTNPKNLVVAIDVSASMIGDRIIMAQEAAKAVVDTLAWKDKIGFVVFNHKIKAKRDLAYVTDNERSNLFTWIENNVVASNGRTELFAPIIDAIEIIKNDTGCSNVILFMTDGDSDFSNDEFKTVKDRAEEESITIFTYALGYEAATKVSKRIACENNGIFYHITNEANLATLMSSYYAYYAAAIFNEGIRWVLYIDAITGTELLTACTALYDNTVKSNIAVIFGAVCMDMNVITSVAQLRNHSGWSNMFAAIESDSETCVTEWEGYSKQQIYKALEQVRKSQRKSGAETCDANSNDKEDNLALILSIVFGLLGAVLLIAYIYYRDQQAQKNRVYPVYSDDALKKHTKENEQEKSQKSTIPASVVIGSKVQIIPKNFSDRAMQANEEFEVHANDILATDATSNETQQVETDVKKNKAVFLVREGLSGKQGSVSFECEDLPDHFIRLVDMECCLEAKTTTNSDDSDDPFNTEASFYVRSPLQGEEGEGDVSLESAQYPDYYVRHCLDNQATRVRLSAFENTDLLMLDSTWNIKQL